MVSILKSAAGVLPPTLRRAASGAVLDLLGLPERLRNPDRRNEPWQTLHNVGGGDFAAAGQHYLELLTRYRIAAGQSPIKFKPWEDGSMVVDPRSPERAIAHPLSALKAAATAAGLDLPNGVAFGCWLPPSAYVGGQDLFIAVKPLASSRP